MKKFTAMICAAAMSASMAITAVAAPSIGQLIPEAPELVSGEIQSGYYLDVQNVDTTLLSREIPTKGIPTQIIDALKHDNIQ